MFLMAVLAGSEWSGTQPSEEEEVEVEQNEAPSPPPRVEEAPPLPEVFAYSTPLVEVDVQARVLLESAPGQSFECTVEALIDPFGQLLDAVATECPDSLRASAVASVRSWQFHPPTVENKAVRGQLTAHFLFVSNTVITEPRTPENVYLVRVTPTATPRWPTPPRPGFEGRAMMRELGVDQMSCTLDLKVDKRGQPTDIRPVSCPDELARQATRRLQRYGLEVEGSDPGDGTTFRLQLWFD